MDLAVEDLRRPGKQMKNIDTKKIEEAIRIAEAGTTGEVVVQIVPRSDSYLPLTFVWGVSGALIGSAYAMTVWGSFLEFQVLGAVGGLVFSQVPSLRRLSLPKKWAAFRVHREVLANFTALGLHQTREHTGILLYISWFERRVEILADSGIHAKLGDSYWSAQVSDIVQGIRSGRPTEGICQAVREMGEKLATHFPGRRENPNELSDTVQLGPKDTV